MTRVQPREYFVRGLTPVERVFWRLTVMTLLLLRVPRGG